MHWTIAYAGRALRLRHAKGVTYLATLLRCPGREVHAVDLAAEIASGDAGDLGAPAPDAGRDAGELIDAKARAAYKRRLAELREDLEQARGLGDADAAEHALAEIDALGRELARAVGLRGRIRKAGSTTERARINVLRAIGAVIRKITVVHPALGERLAATIRTGTYCSYVPDPHLRVDWEL